MDLSGLAADVREHLAPSVAEARERLEQAEAEVAKVEALRGSIPDAALTAALEAQDHVVHEARQALELAEVGAIDRHEPPGAEEIAAGPTGALGDYLEAYGLVVSVEPAFGDRRAGRVGERVRLQPRDA